MKKLILCLPLAAILLSAGLASAQKLKADEIVARHLDSIAPPAVRSAAKTRVAVGDATARFISTKQPQVDGRIVLASESSKNFFGLNMNSSLYPGERMVSDGKNVSVASVLQNSRSLLGNFVQSNAWLVKDSILGGVLFTSWALNDVSADGRGKLSTGGTKKIDGREVYVVDYSKKGDVDVSLYFDKETFRHVRTEYRRVSSAAIGSRPEDSTKFSESRLKVIENFGDFKSEGGMMLPHLYSISYSISGQNGTTEVEWVFKLTEFGFNQPFDPNTFSVQ